MSRSWRAGLACLLLVLVVGGSPGCSRPPSRDVRGSLAAVLLSGPNRVVVIDLSTWTVAHDAALRSLALDMDVDEIGAVAVTAQCGGIGDDCDRAAGLYDLREGGPVRYVELDEVNPGSVAVASGIAWLSHGVYDSGRLYGSVVDVASATATGGMLFADGPGWVEGVAGRIWAVESRMVDLGDSTSTAPATLVSYAPSGSAEASRHCRVDGAMTLVGCEGSTFVLGDSNAVGPGGAEPGSGSAAPSARAWVREITTSSPIPPARRIDGIRAGIADACSLGDDIVVLDRGPEGSKTPSAVVKVDPRTGRMLLRQRLDFYPLAVGAAAGRIMVVDGARGVLRVLDGGTGAEESTVDLGHKGAFWGSIVTLGPQAAYRRDPARD